MKRRLGVIIVLILIIPILSADMITPGTHPITITNKITNINDFPDYIFLSSCKLGIGVNEFKLIKEDGKIEDYYKFCRVSVYALPKSKFESIEDINNELEKIRNESYYTDTNDTYFDEKSAEYLSSINAKEVIKDIQVYKAVSDASIIKEIDNFYSIDLNQIKYQPDQRNTIKNQLIYYYIIIPILTLLIILFIIFKRKNVI
jgi:hypothetical protein